MDTKPLLVYASAAPIAMTTGTDLWTLLAAHPMNIIQIGVRMTVAGGTGSLVLAFDRVPANNGTRVDADIGIISKAAASLTVGKVCKKDVNIKVDKGDLVVAELTTALTTTGTGYIYLLAYAAGEGAVVYDRATTPVVITIESD